MLEMWIGNRQIPRLIILFATTSVFFLVGCGGGSSETEPAGGERVASVPGASATAATSTADVNDKRPLIRIDATEADVTRLRQDWTHCLTQKGGSAYADPKKMMFRNRTKSDPKITAVFDACLAKEPEEEDMREKRKDPAAFKDDNRQWYRCAKSEGYSLTAPDPDTGEFGLTKIGPQGDFGSPKITACKKAAFARN